MNSVESYALALQDVEHEVLCGPESIFGIALRSESVLIAHHDEKEIGVLTKELQGTDDSRHETELLEAINLFIRWFAKYCTVSINKKNLFH